MSTRHGTRVANHSFSPIFFAPFILVDLAFGNPTTIHFIFAIPEKVRRIVFAAISTGKRTIFIYVLAFTESVATFFSELDPQARLFWIPYFRVVLSINKVWVVLTDGRCNL